MSRTYGSTPGDWNWTFTEVGCKWRRISFYCPLQVSDAGPAPDPSRPSVTDDGPTWIRGWAGWLSFSGWRQIHFGCPDLAASSLLSRLQWFSQSTIRQPHYPLCIPVTLFSQSSSSPPCVWWWHPIFVRIAFFVTWKCWLPCAQFIYAFRTPGLEHIHFINYAVIISSAT